MRKPTIALVSLIAGAALVAIPVTAINNNQHEEKITMTSNSVQSIEPKATDEPVVEAELIEDDEQPREWRISSEAVREAASRIG